MGLFTRKPVLPSKADALPGREVRIPVPAAAPGRGGGIRLPAPHYVTGRRLEPPFPDGFQLALFGMGCFWGVEKTFWQVPGVYSTAVGYAGGQTHNKTYT